MKIRGPERSALRNPVHASCLVHASCRNRTTHQVVISHHHGGARWSLVQHRRPRRPSDHTLSGDRVTSPLCFVFRTTRLAELTRPSRIAAFLIENGVDATAPTLLVERARVYKVPAGVLTCKQRCHGRRCRHTMQPCRSETRREGT